MAKYEIISPGYIGRSSDVNASRCVNLYPELNSKDSKSVGSLVGTPGLLLYIDTLLGPIRGMHVFNNLIYFVSGSKLYSVDAAANIFPVIDSGTTAQVFLATSSGSVSMADNGLAPTGGNQLAIADGLNLLIYNVATGIFSGIGYPSKTVAFISGYFVADTGGPGYDVSALNDGSIVGPGSGGWQDVNVSTANAYPSNLMAVVNNHMELWFIKEYSTEVWDITGAVSPLFARQCVVDYGTFAPYSVAKGNNTIFFLASARNGDAGTVVGIGMANGYGVEIVSEPTINFQFTKYTVVSDAFGYCYTDAGHEFYVLTFPSQKATWVFDPTTKMFHERSYYQGSPYVIGRHLGNCYVYAWGKHFVGSYLDGKIYEMSEKFYTDDGQPIASLRVGPPTEDKRDNDYVFISQMQLDAEMGVGQGLPNISQMAIVEQITVGVNPYGLSIGFGSLWVSNITDGTVSRIDLISNLVVATIPVGSNPVGIKCAGGFVWTANIGGDTVSKIDPTTNLVIGTVAVYTPWDFAFDGSYLWVLSNGYYSSGMAQAIKINTVTNAIEATVNIANDAGLQGVVFADGYVFASAAGVGGRVYQINTTTNTLINTFVVSAGGNQCGPLAYDGNLVWVTFDDNNYIMSIDFKNDVVGGPVAVGVEPLGFCYDGKYLWLATYNDFSITKISAPLASIVSSLSVSSFGKPLYLIYDGVGNIWASIQKGGIPGSVMKISAYISNPANNPTVLLSWSTDGGHTWSNDHPATLGTMGNYKNRAIWRRLGASRNRAFRIAISDPVKKVLIGVYMDLEGAG
jgi:YVTN family beta-propeller protein